MSGNMYICIYKHASQYDVCVFNKITCSILHLQQFNMYQTRFIVTVCDRTMKIIVVCHNYGLNI